MTDVITIDDVRISAGWENDQPILIFNNCGPKTLKVDVRYEQANNSITDSIKCFGLDSNASTTVILPEGYENYKRLYIQVGMNREDISIEILKELFKKDKLQSEVQHTQNDNQHINPSHSQEKEDSSESNATMESKRNSEEKDEVSQYKNTHLNTELNQQSNNILDHVEFSKEEEPEDYTQQDSVISILQEQITQLEQTNAERENDIDRINKQNKELSQENSELKIRLDTQTKDTSSDPEHVFCEAANIVLQTLFIQHENAVKGTPQDPKLICEGIESEIKRFEEQYDGQMKYTLSIVKEHLTKIKDLITFELSDLSPPEDRAERIATLVLTDELANDVHFPYLGEHGHIYWNDLKNFTTKLPQVITETQTILHRIVIQLLEGFSPYRDKDAKEELMTRCFYEDYLPNILKIVGLELVHIQIGETEADSRIHDIQGSQRGEFKRGVIADIIQHGIRRISDKLIIRKPVVMRGEPD